MALNASIAVGVLLPCQTAIFIGALTYLVWFQGFAE